MSFPGLFFAASDPSSFKRRVDPKIAGESPFSLCHRVGVGLVLCVVVALIEIQEQLTGYVIKCLVVVRGADDVKFAVD